MENLQTLTTFLGWCTVINFVFLIVASLVLIAMPGLVTKVHSSMFGLDENVLRRDYVNYLANYKILIIVLNLVPYAALRIIA